MAEKVKALTKLQVNELHKKGIPTPQDMSVWESAIEELVEIEEKVNNLTARQQANIFKKYMIPVKNTLESLKISIEHGYILRAVMQYKTLKRALCKY